MNCKYAVSTHYSIKTHVKHKKNLQQLGETQQNFSIRLWQMGKILKEGKWVPHALSEKNKNDRLEKYLNLYNKQHRKSFL